jgi:D-beta-D-heptose 7-phosphate kinase/D-beta-D-heptose 1-phosphate adenosyltransferase
MEQSYTVPMTVEIAIRKESNETRGPRQRARSSPCRCNGRYHAGQVYLRRCRTDLTGGTDSSATGQVYPCDVRRRGKRCGECRFFGTRVVLIGVVGEDEAGTAVRQLVSELPNTTSTLVSQNDRPTIVKTRVVARNQQVIRLDSEHIGPPSLEEAQCILSALEYTLDEVDVILLSDYGKGVLLGDIAVKTIALARKASKLTIVDPKGRDYSRYYGASLITPNLSELQDATGLRLDTEHDVVLASRVLIRDHGIAAVIATRGEHGMSLVTETSEVHVPTVARAVFDVSGAGDTVAATVACGLSVGMLLEQTAFLANAAAGIVVGKSGTSQVTSSELAAAPRHQEFGANDAKIVLAEEAVTLTRLWQSQNLIVGFTNGCFDLLHPSHLSLLSQAKGACDRLVVAINSDESVRRLKGQTRPIQTELARAAVLAYLDMVDLVVIFSEDTPINLIEALRPDLLIKGADYTLGEVVGADVVQAYGGKVMLAELREGFSTSNMIERIRTIGP